VYVSLHVPAKDLDIPAVEGPDTAAIGALGLAVEWKESLARRGPV